MIFPYLDPPTAAPGRIYGHLAAGGLIPAVLNIAGGAVVASVGIAGVDLAHQVTITTGAAGAAALVQLARVTFAVAFPNEPVIVITARATGANFSRYFIQSVSALASYDLYSDTALAALTTYVVNVVAIGI